MKVLELFAGTRSIGKAFEAKGHEVFSVDWEKSFPDIDLYADIGKLTAEEVISKFGKPDVIWMSPDCFPAGTLIWTDKGYKQVEDIACYDMVLTHKNRYRMVYSTQKTNKRDMYKIKISGCEDVLVSSEHPYYVRKKVSKCTRICGKSIRISYLLPPEWRKVSELSDEYKVGIPINQNAVVPKWSGCVYYTTNCYGITASKIVNTLDKYMGNSDFWWMVGRYFGDGSLSVDKCTVDISCNKHQTDELRTKLYKLGIKYSEYDKTTAVHFCYLNKELCEFLKQFGIGAINKQITPIILDLPKDLLKSFIDGYISADGHWEKKSTNEICTFCTISRELAYGMQLCILKAYGRYSSMVVRKNQTDVICGRKVNVHPAYSLSFYKNDNGRFQYVIEDGVAWVNVRDVVHLPSQQTTVYNFSVEEDESYTAYNTIVHNCTTFSVAAISHHRRYNLDTGELEPISDYAKLCDTIDQHCLDLIDELKPKFWFIENPVGALRKMPWMQHLPRYTTTYCKYADVRMKPTDIWTNHPNPQFAPPCRNGDPCHTAAPRGSRTGTQGLKDHVERSRIPKLLCEHIVNICEDTFDSQPNYLTVSYFKNKSKIRRLF